MRRLGFVALSAALVGLGLAGCQQQSTGGAFSDQPTPIASPETRPQLDLAALAALRSAVAQSLPARVAAGELSPTWTPGVAAPLAGPYQEQAATLDALGLLAARSLVRRPSGGAGDAIAGAQQALADATTAHFRELEGPQGAAYLLLSQVAPTPASAPAAVDTPNSCPTPTAGNARPECLRQQVADGLLAAWYAGGNKMFLHLGDTATVYRPVEAISVGAALVVAGYAEHDESKIQAGGNIVAAEMKNDFDPHFGLAYGLVSATAQGGHVVADSNARLADQAGIAESLLEAFDASREAQYMQDARMVLQPLMDEAVAIRGATGYVSGFDVRGAGPSSGDPVDVEAAVLTLQAARHYDRDDGGRFSHLEEKAAGALLAGAASRQPQTGLSGSILAQGASLRSGVVTALAVVVIGQVLDDLALVPSASPTSGS